MSKIRHGASELESDVLQHSLKNRPQVAPIEKALRSLIKEIIREHIDKVRNATLKGVAFYYIYQIVTAMQYIKLAFGRWEISTSNVLWTEMNHHSGVNRKGENMRGIFLHHVTTKTELNSTQGEARKEDEIRNYAKVLSINVEKFYRITKIGLWRFSHKTCRDIIYDLEQGNAKADVLYIEDLQDFLNRLSEDLRTRLGALIKLDDLNHLYGEAHRDLQEMQFKNFTRIEGNEA